MNVACLQHGIGTLLPRSVIFTIPDAQRALRYVASIVRDMNSAFLTVQHCRTQLRSSQTPQQREKIMETRDRALHAFNRSVDECNAVGADVRDVALGRVSLHAEIDGRSVDLVWSLGQPIAEAWANLNDSAPCPTDAHPPRLRARRKVVTP